jgi:hypothetical protein
MREKEEWVLWCKSCLLIFVLSAFSAADSPANVAGTWTVLVSGKAGSATQTLVIQQDGGKISGTFKGPRQSGTLEGAVDGSKITFHVAARRPIDYQGTVDGDTMKGTLSSGEKNGDWTAKRSGN